MRWIYKNLFLNFYLLELRVLFWPKISFRYAYIILPTNKCHVKWHSGVEFSSLCLWDIFKFVSYVYMIFNQKCKKVSIFSTYRRCKPLDLIEILSVKMNETITFVLRFFSAVDVTCEWLLNRPWWKGPSALLSKDHDFESTSQLVSF